VAARFGFAAGLGTGWYWPAGRRPAAAVSGGRLALGRGVLSRQTGTTHFTATTVVDASGRSARPGLAVTGSEGNSVGVELRGGRALAWRSQEGRRTNVGRVRLLPGRPVANAGQIMLRVVVGDAVRLSLGMRGRWRALGAAQPLPRWASGARVALTARRRGPARFGSLSIAPR
jgi:hypothetical protein